MTTLAIPKELAMRGDLVLLPREEYEEYLSFRKLFPVVWPGARERKKIDRARAEIRAGLHTSWSVVKHELAHRRRG